MTIAKRQHILPEMYLKHFVDPDTPPGREPYVWRYDLAKRCWQRKGPGNRVFFSPYYYAYRDKNGQPVNVLEEHLAKVESLAAPLIRKLATRTPLTEREQLHCCLFIAQLAVRTPRVRASTEQFLDHKGREFIAAKIQHWRANPQVFARLQEKHGAISLDDLEKHLPRVVTNDAGLLAYSMLPSISLTERLINMSWRIYFTQAEHQLVICDHPCEWAVPDDTTEKTWQGLFTKDIEFHVPLTPNMLFGAYDDEPRRGFALLDREAVIMMNQRMVRRAAEFIVSQKPSFLGDDELKKANISVV